jgi:hypothetical protein
MSKAALRRAQLDCDSAREIADAVIPPPLRSRRPQPSQSGGTSIDTAKGAEKPALTGRSRTGFAGSANLGHPLLFCAIIAFHHL